MAGCVDIPNQNTISSFTGMKKTPSEREIVTPLLYYMKLQRELEEDRKSVV